MVKGNGWLQAAVVAVLFYLALPVLIVVPVSINRTAALSLPWTGVSLRWYEALLKQPAFGEAALISLTVSLISTAVSLVLGVAAALAIVRHARKSRPFLQMLFLSPLIFPSVVLGAALLLFMSPRGMVPSIQALVIAHVVITLPYIVRSVVASLQNLNVSMEEAALTLGATPWRTFRYVTLPALRPGLTAGATFAFLMSFDEFTVSMFLVGSGATTLPLEIFHSLQYVVNPTLAVVSTLQVVGTALVIFLLDRYVGIEKHFRV